MFNSEGGYHNESMVEETSKYTNTVSVGGGEERGTRATVPVTLSQILKLTGSEGLVIHDKKIMVITTVVQVIEVIEASQSKLQMLTRDHTNNEPIEVQLIGPDSGQVDQKMELEMNQEQYETMMSQEGPRFDPLKIQPGDYIRIYGQVKMINDRPSVVAHRLFPADDPNEITVHHLETIIENMKSERRLNNRDNTTVVPNAGGVRLTEAPQGHSAMPKMNITILNFITKQGPNGVHRDVILSKNFGSHNDVLAAISELSTEGTIWNGVTDDIFVAGA